MKTALIAMRSLGLLVSVSLPLTAVCTRAEDARFPNSEDLRHVKAIAGPALSPDGKQVLFTLTDSTADGAKSHVWMVPVGGVAARQLTYSPTADKRGEHNPVWAPDGSAIFFVAKRGENTQLFRLPLAGGEAMPYELKVLPAIDDSKEPGAIPPAPQQKDPQKDQPKASEAKPEPIAINVGGFAISPHGKWLAVWAPDPETPGEKKAKDAKADAVWVNHEKHGERLYLAALKSDGTLEDSGALKAVDLAPDVRVASWSPQSDRLIVITESPNDASDLGPAGAAWLVTASATVEPIALKGVPATVRGGLAWSEDGTEVVFGAQTPEDAPPGVAELFAVGVLDTRLGGKETTDKTEPRRLMATFNGGLGFGEPVFLQDNHVMVPVTEGTRASAVRLSLDAAKAPESIPQATPVVTGLSTNRKQTGWVWLASASDQPETLCYADKLGGDCTVLATPALTTQKFKSVKSQLVQWQNEGQTIDGLLYLPPEAASGKVPLIVDVHGGPLGAWEDRHDEWTGFLIGHGWAILRPNPRGSSGYGVKFAAANKNDLGGADFRDVMAGVDFAVKNYAVDPDRLALMGYSYGGEMAGFAEGKTDRFKAIISGAPVIDQFSEYGTERGSWYDRWYFGKPWEHMEDAWRQSPLAGAGKAKTPFLLLQGESDGTDPLGQAQEMYRALRQAGVPVELVTYPREDHGPLARGIFGYPSPEPWHGFDGRKRIVEFLEKQGLGKKE